MGTKGSGLGKGERVRVWEDKKMKRARARERKSLALACLVVFALYLCPTNSSYVHLIVRHGSVTSGLGGADREEFDTLTRIAHYYALRDACKDVRLAAAARFSLPRHWQPCLASHTTFPPARRPTSSRSPSKSACLWSATRKLCLRTAPFTKRALPAATTSTRGGDPASICGTRVPGGAATQAKLTLSLSPAPPHP